MKFILYVEYKLPIVRSQAQTKHLPYRRVKFYKQKHKSSNWITKTQFALSRTQISYIYN